MTTRGTRGIPFDDLPPEAKAKVPKLGPNSPLAGESGKAIERARRGSRRAKAGSGFEAELEAVHRIYEMRGKAKLTQVYPPTLKVRTARGWELQYRPGGAPCDFFGAALIGGVSRPVIFDAKSCERTTYAHEPEQVHQLRMLLAYQKVGAEAFLLIRDAKLRVCYIVRDPAVLRDLALGGGITLRAARYLGEGSGRRTANDRDLFDHFYPAIFEPGELLVSQSTPRWDWLKLLETLPPRTEG